MHDVHSQDDARRARLIDLLDALAAQGRALESLHEAIDRHRDIDAETWASVTATQAAEALEESIARTLASLEPVCWERSLEDVAQDDEDAQHKGGPGVALRGPRRASEK